MRYLLPFAILLSLSGFAQSPTPNLNAVRVRDITTIEGVRDNPLVGYGLVIGLNGTGDRRQTIFTTQALSNILQRMGMQVSPGAMRVNNVAAVLVTASLPPFARPGTQLDVTVSSIGDAKSLEGGTLVLAPLHAANGEVYASAQGPLAVGGYAAGPSGNSKQLNHPTVGRVVGGAIVERDNSVSLSSSSLLTLVLRDPDFATAQQIAEAIHRNESGLRVRARDSRTIEIETASIRNGDLVATIGRIQSLTVTANPPARVIVNERTGTIVMGRDVRLGAVSILHGNLSIEISTDFTVSQPAPFSNGETAVVPQPRTNAVEGPARRIELAEGATVEQLVNGLQTIGATSRDVVSILQALKAAGALHAELELL